MELQGQQWEDHGKENKSDDILDGAEDGPPRVEVVRIFPQKDIPYILINEIVIKKYNSLSIVT